MQLRDLSIENLNIAFKTSFQHASAARTSTEAVLVKAISRQGTQGIGEGCPRDYVTGESVYTAQRFFESCRGELIAISSLQDLTDWIVGNRSFIDKNPAAFCALELALLDVLAQENNQTLEALLSLAPLSGKFHYTAVLGAADPQAFQAQLQRYLKLGIADFKIKLFGDAEIDLANCQAVIESAAENSRIRFDANNLWADSAAAIRYLRQLNVPVFALEEPVAVNQYSDCLRIFDEIGIKIILDESFINESQFESIQARPAAWIINIRVSKMGGILRSLEIANRARQVGIPIIIGAQVGETSILTRAALTVANANRDILLAQEGAFGTYLLEHDLVEPSIKFGMQGIVEAAQL